MTTERQWLKITFDPSRPGVAKVANQRKRTPGQWVVFDKNLGVGGLKSYWPGLCLFASSDIKDCHAFIDARRGGE